MAIVFDAAQNTWAVVKMGNAMTDLVFQPASSPPTTDILQEFTSKELWQLMGRGFISLFNKDGSAKTFKSLDKTDMVKALIEKWEQVCISVKPTTLQAGANEEEEMLKHKTKAELIIKANDMGIKGYYNEKDKFTKFGMKTANNIIIKQIVDVMREARNEGSNQDKEDGSENQDEDDDDKAESSENQEQEDADGSDKGSNEDA
jgi:hypothetical protein